VDEFVELGIGHFAAYALQPSDQIGAKFLSAFLSRIGRSAYEVRRRSSAAGMPGRR
jgi:hypothetical protein